MSTWYPIEYEDIDIEEEEVNLYVYYDHRCHPYGAVYATLTHNQIRDIASKIAPKG